MPRVIEVREFKWADVDLDELTTDGVLDVYDWVAKGDYFSFRVTTRKAEVQARGWVGLIPLNERVTLNVRPRVDVEDNLARLMEVSGYAPDTLADTLRGYVAAGRMYPSLVRIYADSLAREMDLIAQQGLFREYHRREETSSTPHGRILIGPSIQKSIARGRNHELTISWFERSVDNAVNRCLLYGIHQLYAHATRYKASIPAEDLREVYRQLNRCGQMLNGVSLDHERRFLSDQLVDGTRALPTSRGYYRPALDLALAIIGGHGLAIDVAEGSLKLPLVLIQMDQVFERYAREVLRRGGLAAGWPMGVLDGNVPPGRQSLLHDNLDIHACPDVVVASQRGSQALPPVILDAKYKPLTNRRPERSDLNQVLAYGASYRARHVAVVVPCGPDRKVSPGLHRVGRIDSMEVWLHVLDLGAESILDEEAAFVREIGTLVTSGRAPAVA